VLFRESTPLHTRSPLTASQSQKLAFDWTKFWGVGKEVISVAPSVVPRAVNHDSDDWRGNFAGPQL
jgi:hypothetical protein